MLDLEGPAAPLWRGRSQVSLNSCNRELEYGEVLETNLTSIFPACCRSPWMGFQTYCRRQESWGSEPEDFY